MRKQVIERLREKEAPVGFKEKFSIHALQASVPHPPPVCPL